MNYYGTRLATCSSDHLVKIFEIKTNGQAFPMAELTGHDVGLVFIGIFKKLLIWACQSPNRTKKSFKSDRDIEKSIRKS